MFNRVRERLLAINVKEASFDRRGFDACGPVLRAKLEGMLLAFIDGYHLALKNSHPEMLAEKLRAQFDDHHVGFAFEGVGMCLALFDLLALSKHSRMRAFTDGAGSAHDYIVTVGAGFACARVPWGLRAMDGYARKLDPLIAWCVPDGYGFHQGFFHHKRFIDTAAEPPASFTGYSRELFDSGIGRSLWWVKGANPERIREAIDAFPKARRPELWSGVGVAASYAGGVAADDLLGLRQLSGPYRADFLTGVPFAARLRQKGGNHSPVTNLACRVLLDMTADEAADLIASTADDVARDVAGMTGVTAGYALVRQRLLNHHAISLRSEVQR